MPTAVRGAPPGRTLRANLIVYRAQRGLSQAALAQAAGVNRLTISRLESSATEDVALSTIERLAAALDTTVIELLTPTTPRQLSDEELLEREASGDVVSAKALHAALDEAEGIRYSRAGRRRRLDR